MKIPFCSCAMVCLFSLSACGETLRIATYNLNWGNRRGDQVLSAIVEANPDVICFQETTKQSEKYLSDRLSKTHPHFFSQGHDGRYSGERFAIASSRPLCEIQFFPPGEGLFGFVSAKLSLESAQVHLVNVHLTPVRVQRGDGWADLLTKLNEAEAIHESEIGVITKQVDADQPTIVLGDFNSISTGIAPLRLRELGFCDAVASVDKDADRKPTWRWPTRPLPLQLRIDYIFHSRHFKTKRARVIDKEGSDHSLVIAELEFASGESEQQAGG